MIHRIRYGFVVMLLLAVALSGCGTQYALAVSVEGSGAVAPDPGTVIVAPGKATFSKDELVTLIATSATGWAFSHWAGDLSGSDNPATLVMDSTKTVTAVYVRLQYGLTADVEPAAAGTISNILTSYEHGQTVQVTANAATGWVFDHWTGDVTGSENPAELEMTRPKTIVGVFRKTEHTLTVNTSPADSGTVKTGLAPQGEGAYGAKDGEIVQLTAIANTGFAFDHWEGALTGSRDNPATVSMDASKTVTAVFVRLQYDLSATVEPVDAGSVSTSLVETTRSYAHGQTVRLTANPAEGWEFDHWTGDLTGSVSPADVEMNGRKTITAVFRKRDYDFSVVISPTGAGTVKTAIIVQTRVLHGQTVQLTASPNPGYLFDHWEGDLAGTTNPASLAVDGARTVTAVFIPWQTIDPPMRRVPGPITFPLGEGDWDLTTVDHAFWMAETEVTYEQWYPVRIWALSHGYQFANAGREGAYAVGGPPSANKRHPVTSVGWRDALVWCNALTEYYNRQYGAGLVCVYTYDGRIIRDATETTACDNVVADATASGFRLPTRTEWDLAAKYIIDANGNGILDAGEYYPGSHISGDVSNPYDTSSRLGNYAWYDGNSGLTTHPVATKAPNALGIYDMSGNANEWCFDGNWDWRDFCGGSFMYPASVARIGWGANTQASSTQWDRGFRIARNL